MRTSVSETSFGLAMHLQSTTQSNPVHYFADIAVLLDSAVNGLGTDCPTLFRIGSYILLIVVGALPPGRWPPTPRCLAQETICPSTLFASESYTLSTSAIWLERKNRL